MFLPIKEMWEFFKQYADPINIIASILTIGSLILGFIKFFKDRKQINSNSDFPFTVIEISELPQHLFNRKLLTAINNPYIQRNFIIKNAESPDKNKYINS